MGKWEVYIQESHVQGKPGFALVRIAENCIHGRVFYFSQPGGRAAAIAEAERLCAEWNKPSSELIYSMESGVVAWFNDKDELKFAVRNGNPPTFSMCNIEKLLAFIQDNYEARKEADDGKNMQGS